MSESVSSIERCETCGTTKIKFDPPLIFNEVEACGAWKPGLFSFLEEIPKCEMPKGHEGNHIFLLEKLIEWPNV